MLILALNRVLSKKNSKLFNIYSRGFMLINFSCQHGIEKISATMVPLFGKTIYREIVKLCLAQGEYGRKEERRK